MSERIFKLCLRVSIFVASACIGFIAGAAQFEVRVSKNIPYKSGLFLSDYEMSRCKLDLHVPAKGSNFPVLVWFHGGALKEGAKDERFSAAIARRLSQDGLAIASVNYRLSPQAKYPAYLEDAAAAVAWVLTHASENRLDPGQVFVCGHSAGGYLTAIIGLDDRWLGAFGAKPSMLAGLIPISGQMMTHFTIREERGIKNSRTTIVADDAAPVFHARSNTPPWLVLYADNDMPTRAEENVFFVSVMRTAGNKRVESMQIPNRTHGNIAEKIPEPNDPVAEAILRFCLRR